MTSFLLHYTTTLLDWGSYWIFQSLVLVTKVATHGMDGWKEYGGLGVFLFIQGLFIIIIIIISNRS